MEIHKKWALVCVAVWLLSSSAFAQTDVSQWPTLSDQEFVAIAKPAWKANKKAPKITRRQITTESVRRLTETNAPETADFALLNYLSTWSAGKLADDQRAKILQALRPRQSQALAGTAKEMSAYCDVLSQSGADLAETDAIVVEWLSKQQLSALSVAELESLCARLMQLNVKANRLRVEWQGVIKPEKEDRYQFFFARSTTDLQYRTGSVKSEMRLWIGEQEIIDSKNDGWSASSAGILLGPNNPQPIRVEFLLDRTQNFFAPGFPGIAMLEWKTETTQRDLVPASAFYLPDGKGHGLEALYRCYQFDLVRDREKLVTTAKQIEPQIDRYWYELTHHELRPNRKHVEPLVAELLKRYVSAEHLAERAEIFAKDSGRNIPGWRQTSELMSSEQRRQFMRGLLAHPTFVPGLRYHNLKRIYEMIFPGAEEACLDICVRWFQLQPDMKPKLDKGLFYANVELGLLAELIARQEGGVEYFRDRAVRADDGSCRSMAGYTVAWSYANQGRLPELISWLDEQLVDPQLSGDRRVNWLIIRGHAQEILATPPGFRTNFDEQPMQALPYLEQAYAAAESEPVKLRVLRELVFRLYKSTRLEQIKTLLTKAENDLKLEESKAGVASLRNTVSSAMAKSTAPKAFDEVAEKEYLQVLRERAEVARQRADIASLDRYKELIKQITGEDSLPLSAYPQDVATPKAAEPADASEKKSLTREDLEPQIAAFHRRHLTEAYQQHGERDARWDLRAEAFLDELALNLAGVPWEPGNRQLLRLGEATVAAGCNDPLVRFGLLRVRKMMRSGTGIDALEIARALSERGDSPHLSAYLAAVDAERLGWNIERKENPDSEGMRQSYEKMIEYAGKFLAPAWIQPGEERAAFEALEPIFGLRYYLWPGSRELIEKVVEDSKVSPWVGHMFAAEYYHDQGWAGRGGGYAGSVTEDGWKIFGENMFAASQHLQKAHAIKPDWPEAAAAMIEIVGTGADDSSESMEQWFLRAVEAQPDYLEAYNNMFHFLLPRWNGTNEMVERVGLYGLQTKKFETMAPAAYYNALNKLASYESTGKYCFWRVAAKMRYAELQGMCEEYEKSNRLRWYRYYFRSIYLGVAWHAGDYEKALALLKEVEQNPHSTPMADMGINVQSMVEEVHALGGKAGETVKAAQKHLAEKRWDDAQKLIDEALQAYQDEPYAVRFLQHLAASQELQQKIEAGGWVDLKFDKELTGWQVDAGTWKIRDANTILGRASGKPMNITLLAPLGNCYEFRGEVAIPKTRYRSDVGGFFFGKSIFPTAEITGVMLCPTQHTLGVETRSQIYRYNMGQAEQFVRGDANVFHVSVWNDRYLVRINGKPIGEVGTFRQGQSLEGPDAPLQFVGLTGHYFYDGPEVLYRKLQVRCLTELPKDFDEN